MTTLRHASVSHAGLHRARNEDNLAIDEELGLYLVADGMGGHEHGDVASRLAVETIPEALRYGSGLADAIVLANGRILEEPGSGGATSMGTTVCAVRVADGDYELAWVGDSRAYRFDGRLTRLTSDHTYVQGMVDRGEIDAEDARRHPYRSMLLQALGVCSDDELHVSTERGTLQPGTGLLLCTDGLTEELSDEEIESVLRRDTDSRAAVDGLLDAALDRGGHDNITLIFIQALA